MCVATNTTGALASCWSGPYSRDIRCLMFKSGLWLSAEAGQCHVLHSQPAPLAVAGCTAYSQPLVPGLYRWEKASLTLAGVVVKLSSAQVTAAALVQTTSASSSISKWSGLCKGVSGLIARPTLTCDIDPSWASGGGDPSLGRWSLRGACVVGELVPMTC